MFEEENPKVEIENEKSPAVDQSGGAESKKNSEVEDKYDSKSEQEEENEPDDEKNNSEEISRNLKELPKPYRH